MRFLRIVVTLALTLTLGGDDMAIAMSAMRRTILASSPVAYWPLEDGTDATIAGSGLPGGSPLVVSGQVDFSTVTGPLGSGSLPGGFLADTGVLKANLPRPTTTDRWTIALVVQPNPGASGVFLTWSTPTGSSDMVRWTLQYYFDLIFVEARSSTGTQTTIHSIDLYDDLWHHVAVAAYQDGSDVVVTFYLDGVAGSTSTVNSVTLSPISQLRIAGSPPSPWTVDFGLGHVALYDHADVDVAMATRAMGGYVGEQAHIRIRRLALEAGIPFRDGQGTWSRADLDSYATWQ